MSQQPPPPPGPPEGWDRPSGEPTQPQGQGWGQQQPAQPQGPPTGQQSGWGQGPTTQTPQKRSRGRTFALGCLGLVGVLFLIGIIAAIVGGGDDGSQTASNATSGTTREPTRTTEAKTEAPGIGTPVRDGKFEFTVRKVECGKSKIGSSGIDKNAQGQFCLVYLKVENIGKESQLLDGGNQYLFGPGGQRFDADSEAAVYLDQAQTFLNEINPGNTVNGIVVFDIPKSVKPAKIELHDSAFSGGVTVEL